MSSFSALFIVSLNLSAMLVSFSPAVMHCVLIRRLFGMTSLGVQLSRKIRWLVAMVLRLACLLYVSLSSSVRERRKKRFLSEEEKRYCVKRKLFCQEGKRDRIMKNPWGNSSYGQLIAHGETAAMDS